MVLTTVMTNIVERTRWSSAEIANDILSALLLVIVQGLFFSAIEGYFVFVVSTAA